MKHLIVSVILCTFLLLGYTTTSHAQLGEDFFNDLQNQLQTSNQTPIGNGLFLPEGIEEQLSIDLFPKIPKPDEEFSIILESFSTDLDKARISWYVDGELAGSQVGGHTVTLRAPSANESSLITVVIEKIDGAPLVREVTVAPANVDILFEASTYTPPFYKGRSLFTNESQARFVAQPSFVDGNGRSISPQNLVYTWRKDGRVVKNASGYGKNVFEVQGQLIQRPLLIEVEVEDLNSSRKAYDLITVSVSDPFVALYKKDPLQGIQFERNITNTMYLGRDEIEFIAVPYFFSADRLSDKHLEYSWSINGKKITNVPSQKSNMIFRNTTGEEGYSNVSVSAKHTENILQHDFHDVRLDFSKDIVDEDSFKTREGFIF